MPRRKRRDLKAARTKTPDPAPASAAGPPAAAAVPTINQDAAMFAERIQEAEEARRQAQRDVRTAREQAEEGVRLQAAKDDAAAALKAVRRRERIRPGEVEAADLAYRSALAALLTFETGTAPAWAAKLAQEEVAPEPEAPTADEPASDERPDPEDRPPDD